MFYVRELQLKNESDAQIPTNQNKRNILYVLSLYNVSSGSSP